MWLQGDEVKAFELGEGPRYRVLVHQLRALHAFMPHLADLQKRYHDKGVTVIGCTAKAFNDTEEMAVGFVKKRGPALRYCFALADERSFAAWMTAAGREAIPQVMRSCS